MEASLLPPPTPPPSNPHPSEQKTELISVDFQVFQEKISPLFKDALTKDEKVALTGGRNLPFSLEDRNIIFYSDSVSYKILYITSYNVIEGKIKLLVKRMMGGGSKRKPKKITKKRKYSKRRSFKRKSSKRKTFKRKTYKKKNKYRTKKKK